MSDFGDTSFFYDALTDADMQFALRGNDKIFFGSLDPLVPLGFTVAIDNCRL